jgi:hypothetical protein
MALQLLAFAWEVPIWNKGPKIGDLVLKVFVIAINY